ncbi:hypothetical protein ACIRED_25715, partial [Streptomyces roseolilacinus]
RGAEAVRTMPADPSVARHVHAEVRAEVAAALDAPDGAARLRARGEPYDDPAALPRLLGTSRGTGTLRDLFDEPYAHDVRALAAANRRTPFMPKAAEELARHEDATNAERAEFRLTLLNAPWRTGGRIAGNLTPPARRLAGERLDESADEWAVGMVRAGLLDPADLLTTARPAAHAVRALHALAAQGLWPETARGTFTALLHDTVGNRPDAWEALFRLLPTHPGTPADAFREAGGSAGTAGGGPATAEAGAAAGAGPGGGVPAAEGDVPAAEDDVLAVPGPPREPQADAPPPLPPPAPAPAPPAKPVGVWSRSALGAVDLLFSLAPDGAAPLPDDRGALRYLAAHGEGDAPGWRHPRWLWRACAAQGLDDLVHPCETPTRAEALTWLAEAEGAEAAARVAERAFLHGVLNGDDLLHHLPAARLLRLPYGWHDLAFTTAWRRALAAFLDRELGTDADAWLRLAAAARDAAPDGGADAAAWPELLDRSRRADPRPVGGPREPLPADDGAPATAEAALRRLARGDHLWAWPLGALLCEARPEAVAAVLPRLGPDGPWLLAAYLLRHRPTPAAPFAHLLHLRDPAALRILSAQCRRLDDGAVHRLLDLADPDVDLAVLCATTDPEPLRRIAARPGPAAARLAADLRADPLATPPGGTVWLESAEPDLIAYVFARSGRHLGLAQQLAGCLSLLRHGGRARLAALEQSGVLGATATRLCRKALASDDPQAPLAARLERELSADRLVARLRRAGGAWRTREILDGTPCPRDWDWDALDAAHRDEPIPHWEQLVRHPEAPRDFRLRNAAHLHAPSRGAVPPGRELTVARVRYGLGVHHREPVDAVLDDLLETGRLTGRDLVHEAAPAAVVLAYLNRARRRRDAPGEVRAAVAETARLVRDRLGGDPGAWHRVTGRLTERDGGWDPVVPVPSLLSVR